ncbi:hypothetical protein L873DRAFT_1810139 [Choiromyces venosus 120613-1]|uniref:Uncharacterized protein n=1 Tax=Choiromyces venosus 120613-1 TaxID=1336337 RepID=A0A3N4JKP5_9PEZI|nr:hypothetical protein L873DRAFT_1810139 [Choiromyces venosus 120613-1]
MSHNHKQQSPKGYNQFPPQRFNYPISNGLQLNFDGHQGQSHGFVQGDFLQYALTTNLSSYNTRGANYPSQNIRANSQHLAQVKPLYQQPPPRTALPQRGRSYTIPGAKNPQPTTFEGCGKASWNQRPVHVSGGARIPSSQNDPYAGVRKWNELNSQQFFEKPPNSTTLSRISPPEAKPIPLGPRYTRTRRKLELHQQLQLPSSQRLHNPRHLPSNSHARHQPRSHGKRIAKGKLSAQSDKIHAADTSAASGSEGIRMFDRTALKSIALGQMLLEASDVPMSKNGGSKSGANDEYMGYIIPSDPHTFHPVQKSGGNFKNLQMNDSKVEVTKGDGAVGKDQVTALISQLSRKVDSSRSKPGSSSGAAENHMSKDSGRGSGVGDEYMGFIIPSDPYTFHPVQKSSRNFQNLGTDNKKLQITEDNRKDQITTLVPQQPALKVYNSDTKKGHPPQPNSRKDQGPPLH